MNTDVPPGLWYGVTAAVGLVFLLAIAGVGRAASDEDRRRVLAGLTAWLALAVVLAAVGVFATSYRRPAPVIAAGIIVPIVLGVFLLRGPGALNRALDSIPLRALIGVQLYRVLGGVFIIGWALGRIPAIFALPAGIGDIAVGLAAPFVAARIGDGIERSRKLAVWWNIDGLADFVVAVLLGAPPRRRPCGRPCSATPTR